MSNHEFISADWWETVYSDDEAIEEAIDAHWPDLREAAMSGRGAVRRVVCPSGHELLYVSVDADHNWRPYLVATNRRGVQVEDPTRIRTLEAAQPTGDGMGGALPARFTLRCTKCAFSETIRAARLMRRYLVSDDDRPIIHLG